MKNFLICFQLALFSWAMASCGQSDKETEEILSSTTWVTDIPDEEKEVSILGILEFDLGNDGNDNTVATRFVYSVDGYGEVLNIRATGTWEADAKEIRIKWNDNIKASANDEVLAQTGETEENLVRQFKSVLLEDGNEEKWEILTLSRKKLIIKDEEGDKTEFSAKGTSDDSETVVADIDMSESDEAATEDDETPMPSAQSSGNHARAAFSGTVGKYPIEMELTLNSDNSVTGRYRYTKSGGGWLTLTGHRDGDYMELFEYTSDGQSTGEFSGTVNAGMSWVEYSGTFTNSKGKSFKFSLNGAY